MVAEGIALLFLLLELGWILTVGFEVEAEKTYFGHESLKVKKLYSLSAQGGSQFRT